MFRPDRLSETMAAWKPRPARLGLLVSLLVLPVFSLTAARTVQPFDSAELIVGSVTLGIVHPPGYPLYLLMGYLVSRIPLGDAAFRLHLMSGFFGAISAGLLSILTYRLTEDPIQATLSALLAAFSIPLWEASTIAEVYTLQTALMLGGLLCLVSLLDQPSGKRILLLAFVLGIPLAHRPNEALFLTLTVGIVLVFEFKRLRPVITPVVVIGSVLLWIVSLIWYLYIPLTSYRGPALDYASTLAVPVNEVSGLWWYISGRLWQHLFFAYNPIDYSLEILRMSRHFLQVWSIFGLVLGIVGGYYLLKRSVAWGSALLILLLIHLVFYAGYRVPDKDEMLISAILISTIFVAAGLTRVCALDWVRPYRPVLFLAILSLMAVAIGFNSRIITTGHVQEPYRQTEAILTGLPPRALIVADWESAPLFHYSQSVNGLRRDVEVLDYGLYGLGFIQKYREAGIPIAAAARFAERDVARLVEEAQASARPVFSMEPYSFMTPYFILEPEAGIYIVRQKDQ